MLHFDLDPSSAVPGAVGGACVLIIRKEFVLDPMLEYYDEATTSSSQMQGMHTWVTLHLDFQIFLMLWVMTRPILGLN